MPAYKDPEICEAARLVIVENAVGVPAKAIAAAMGWSVFKLYELADPESTRHIWDIDIISLFLCGGRDDRLLQALCRKLGGVFVDLQQYGPGKRAEGELAAVLREAGDFCAKAARALEDGKVTAREKDHLREEGEEAVRAVVAFLAGQGVRF